MARIKILELPTQVLGEAVSTPFVVIVDQVESESTYVSGSVEPIRTDIVDPVPVTEIERTTGAQGVIVYPGTLDIDRD